MMASTARQPRSEDDDAAILLRQAFLPCSPRIADPGRMIRERLSAGQRRRRFVAGGQHHAVRFEYRSIRQVHEAPGVPRLDVDRFTVTNSDEAGVTSPGLCKWCWTMERR
jgi:hypothetical protein